MPKARLVFFKAFIDERPCRTIRLGLVWRNLESRHFIEQLAQGSLRTAAEHPLTVTARRVCRYAVGF